MTSGPGRTSATASASFETFIATAGNALLRVATVITADPAAAQDVVQAALERAFRHWGRIAGLDYPEAYVRRMVVNEALSLRRRAKRIVLTDEVPEPAPGPDPSGRIGEIEELGLAVRRLPPKQRTAIALRYFCDLADAQIAEHMGCREGTVRGYVLRGLRTLRVDLDVGAAAPASRDAATRPTSPQQERS
ncbi:MAG TPA: SigE family RNA polymerase sigma factor [Jatrophihabitantaceae bacterium]|nr:SigE family RNA polymerase sigma factor [Jatrophihabitantaceae bacterium]